jgi:hypothetical protein
VKNREVAQLPPTSEADLDLDLLMYLQTLTPEERLLRHEGALELVRELRKASEELSGVDPRAAAAAHREHG